MPDGMRRGVLFDLDGTLVDTAPDMVGALGELRAEEGLPPLPFAQLRGHVSHGSLGLIRVGFGSELPQPRLERLRERFLALYADRLCAGTRLFPGMDAVLDALEAQDVAWGVVTNKPGFLTEPLLQCLGLHRRSRCVVSGDTLPVRKPDPAPLLHAAELCGLAGPDCIYIGDAERDIAAGRAAGMRTAIANWGYIDASDTPGTWGADAALDSPADALSYLFPDMAR